MLEPINLYKYKHTTVRSLELDKWRYVRKNWLTDKLWNYLLKKGCLENAIREDDCYERILIDHNKLNKKVMEVLESLYRYDYRVSKIYMGHDEFNECLYDKTIDLTPYDVFDIKASIYEGRNIYNIPVTVIPHMKGVLVV